MEAKELMINDLVWYVDEPIKVKHNYGKSIRYDDDSKFSHEVEQSYIKPIPLTQEILKANGFEYKDAMEEWWHYNEFPLSDFQLNDSYDEEADEWCISIRINNCDYNIHYVHELQHALRLCGLSELADNFKIKED